MMLRPRSRPVLLSLLLGAATLGWAAVASAAQFVDISAGGRATCAVSAQGTTFCWGDGREGQLGRIGQNTARIPTRVIGTYDARQVSVGTSSACQLIDRGSQLGVRGIFACWGNNARGQVGDGREQRAQYPQETRVPDGLTRVETGTATVCALGAGGVTYCWGDGAAGQLGDGAQASLVRTPQQVPGVTGIVDIALGDQHVCGARSDGRMICWGWTRNGRAGLALGPLVAPEVVPGLNDVTAVAAGASHTCVLRRAGGGTVWCMGSNERGQLGIGAPVGDVLAPAPVPGLSGITQLDADGFTTCAASADGRMWCWGYGGTGQIGDGSRDDARAPQPVADLADVAALTVGDNHVCALTRRGAPYCWGSNRYGQLGNGDRTGLGVHVRKPRLVVDRLLGRATFVPRDLQSFPSGTSGGTIELRSLIVRTTSRRFSCPSRATITISAEGRAARRTVRDVTRRSATTCRISGSFALPARTDGATVASYTLRGTHLRTLTARLRAQRIG